MTIGGWFESAGGVPRSLFAVLDATTGDALPFAPAFDGEVSTFARSCDTLYAGGDFSEVSSQDRPYAVALSDAGVRAWRPEPDDPVQAVAVMGRTVYLGGEFREVGGQDRRHLASVDATSGALCAWDPVLDEEVEVLLPSGARLYVAGEFERVGIRSVRGLAVFEP